MSFEFPRLDPQALYAQMRADLEEDLGELLNPGDERLIVARNILEALVAYANQAVAYAKSQLLRYASGPMLDELALPLDVARKPARPAQTTVRFTVEPPVGMAVEIPAGIRVTADGKRYFETAGAVTVPWGVSEATVEAVATLPGADHNGYPPGSVNVIIDVDFVPFVTGCINLDLSHGGADEEDDEVYRERIRLAPSQFSVAGSKEAYKYWAMTADADIADVSVRSPAPVEVAVAVLIRGGGPPAPEVLDRVSAVLSDDRVRPLSDKVTVAARGEASYTVTGTYYISRSDSTDEPSIKAEVEAAYQRYLSWQSAKLGRAVNPDELRRLLLQAGAHRLDLISPTYRAIAEDEAAWASPLSELTYGGLL